MKRLLSFFIAFVVFSGITMAQDAKETKKIAKPASLGHASTDAFVDDAFAIYDKVYDIKAKLAESEVLVAELEKKSAPKASEIKAVDATLTENTNQLKSLQTDATKLLGQFDDVMKKSKTITPKTKVPKAAKAVNNSKKALMSTKNEIPAQLKIAADQQARLEAIKVLNK